MRPIALLAVCLGLLAVRAAPAGAASWPATKPTGVVVRDITHSSFVVTLAPTLNADAYRLWISPNKADVYVAALTRPAAARRAYVSKTPRFSVTGLAYRATPYYVRLATAKGPNYRVGDTFELWLRPTTPTVTTTVDGAGARLTWPDLAVTGYEIRRATDTAFTTAAKTYTLRGRSKQFTPYGLVPGTAYSVQVRAVNGGTRSAWSPLQTITPVTAEAKVRVVTYNLLGMWADNAPGDFGAGEMVTPWNTSRRITAAATVRPASPDVILVQEGSAWTNLSTPWGSPWQVDTFASTLGAGYVVARTQGRAGDPDYTRTNRHIVYKASTVEAVGDGDNWALPNGRFAAYQLMQHMATGARFLAVSVHNTSSAGAASDAMRLAEMRALSDHVATYRAAHSQVPVVLGGDVASYRAHWHPYDPPGIVMRSAGYVDTLEAAQFVSNSRYSSYNHFRRRPWKDTGSADRIFASPGVGVTGWTQLLHLRSDGTFDGPIPSDHNPVVADVTIPYADGGS